MAFDTIIQGGSFTADGANKRLAIRSDYDYIEVFNRTAAAQATADLGYEFHHHRGDTDGRGYFSKKLGTVANDPVTVGQIAADGGFIRLNTSENPLSARTAIDSTTNATQPVVSTSDTGSLADGDVVRMVITGQESLGGIDFQISSVVADTSFTIAYAMANSPGAAGTAGFWRKVKYDPIFYPRRRYIANITAATEAVVTFTVDHGLTVGQEVRMNVPDVYDMVEMDGLSATITAVTASTITLDIDSSGFTAFSFPLPADVPFTPAIVVPYGEDTAEAIENSVDLLGGATENKAIIGVELVAGNDSPAGNNNDVIEWRAYKFFSVNNE